jgi:hypothetical protein
MYLPSSSHSITVLYLDSFIKTYCLFIFVLVLGIKLRALSMLRMCFTSEVLYIPLTIFFSNCPLMFLDSSKLS